MKLFFSCVVLAALTSLAPGVHADEPLSQTTISIYANGKPVGGFIFPIGAAVKPSAISNDTLEDGKETRYAGNVQGRFTPPPGQPVVLFGEHVVIKTEAISAERAKAVQDLDAMWESDQQYRGRTLDGTELTADEWKLQTAIDVANLKRLIEIIDNFGWPGVRFAGGASQAAFLVLQHADTATQRKYLPLLRDAVKRHDAMGSHLAMLEDRVRLADGKPQLYGTQLSGNPLRFDPIEDPAHVDQRRRSVGLEPLAEFAKQIGVTYVPGTPVARNKRAP
jgi:hypothetical protein